MQSTWLIHGSLVLHSIMLSAQEPNTVQELCNLSVSFKPAALCRYKHTTAPNAKNILRKEKATTLDL